MTVTKRQRLDAFHAAFDGVIKNRWVRHRAVLVALDADPLVAALKEEVRQLRQVIAGYCEFAAPSANAADAVRRQAEAVTAADDGAKVVYVSNGNGFAMPVREGK